MADEKDQEGTPAPAVTFGTKEEYTAAVEAAVNKALAPKLKANTQLEAELESLRPLQEQVTKLQQQIDGGQQTDDQRHTAELETLQKQLTGLQAQVEQANGNTAKVTQAWHGSVGHSYLQGLALEAGAAPTAVADIPGLFPAEGIQVKPNAAGQLIPLLVDPSTDLAHQDQVGAMREFLSRKPHLMAPPPNGAGQGGAGPQPPHTQKFEDLPADDQLDAGLKEYFG